MAQYDTDVIVVGNGPAGIALSTFLSGWHPFYNHTHPHPNQLMHERLNETSSLLLQSDLDQWYLNEYEQRNPNVGIYSDLYDQLMRPESTNEGYNPRAASCLKYKHSGLFEIPHIVLGDGQVGGSWNQYDDNMETVSLSNWMDLPAYSLAEFLGGQPLLARLPAGIIREYMHAYVEKLNIQDHFIENTTVTNITKLCCDLTQAEYWRVQGHYADGRAFELTCNRVVLACGRKQHRTLEVEGELNAMNVVYNLRAMKQLFQQQNDLNKANVNDFNGGYDPVIVVGDGISAADTITHCLKNQIPILHVFRRTEKQLKSTMLSRLSSNVYPEYSKIFDLMLERNQHPCYRRAPASVISSINPDSSAVLKHLELDRDDPKREEHVAYRCLVICVGLQTELTMLEDKHDFNSNYQSQQDQSLYAIGSVVGDHFIRYLIGGSFRVAQRLIYQSRMDRCWFKQRNNLQSLENQCYYDVCCRLQESKCGEEESGVMCAVDTDMNHNIEDKRNDVRKCFFPQIFCRLLS